MSLNWKEIDLILEELQLPGCHIQGIHQPSFSSLVLELYRPGEPFLLFISLAPRATRIHRMSRSIRKAKKTQRFAEFLRSRIRGGRISGCEQLGNERIIHIDVRRGDEESVLWIRLWGGAANIVVCDSRGTILDALYRRPSRGEISGEKFNPEQEISRAMERSGERPAKVFEIRQSEGSGDFNARIEAEYRQREEDQERIRLKDRLKRLYADRDERIQSAIGRLRLRLSEYERAEQQKLYGDLIMANLHRITRGEEWVNVQNYEDEGREIRIPLEATLSPAANAEKYYERYKKAHSGLEIVRDEIRHLELSLSALSSEAEATLATEDLPRLREQYREMSRTLADEKQGGGKEQVLPGLEFRSGPYRILIGRSATENDRMLRHVARGNDVWLHTRDYPGAYVFIKHIPGKSIPLDTLLDAGNLAVFYSKARSSGYAELYYTQVKYLRRPREGKKGLVLPTQERNLSVRLETERLERLQIDKPRE